MLGRLPLQVVIFFVAIIVGLVLSVPVYTRQSVSSNAGANERLANGEVVVDLLEQPKGKYVTGRIIIDETPQRVWPIVANPFEFEGKIFPRLKQVEVLLDKRELSILRCAIDMGFPLPQLKYVVQSSYKNGGIIEFKRVSGLPRYFEGSWQVLPFAGGSKSEVVYSLYVDPGFMIPVWIVRQGVKAELPRTLIALRTRVEAVSRSKELGPLRTIEAAMVANASDDGNTASSWRYAP